ncbi:MAG: hypothetical protein HY381_00185, partial [Candidatus Chisholmbacteria bacterium]|nr:hypothetical protein [Candidatus Chisholmbacteria bacterium]
MTCLLKKIWFFWLLAFSFSLFAPPARAAQEFDTNFTATYLVNPAGATTVTQDIRLTNKLANVYASEYTLTIGSTKISQISATTPQGYLPSAVTTTDNSTSIHLKFPESHQVVGKDQTLSFTMSYQNQDIASKNGRVLEVNIPQLANLEDLNSYTVTLLVPTSFDLPTLISPPPT